MAGWKIGYSPPSQVAGRLRGSLYTRSICEVYKGERPGLVLCRTESVTVGEGVWMPMRVLVLGAGGQVGRELAALSGGGIEVLALPRSLADITQPATVREVVRAARCDAVVNAAADTAVDQAEQEPEAAFAVNRDGAAHVARACVEAGVPLVHLSTDYVFDGGKAGLWLEEDPAAPLNVYGASKLAGERAVAEILSERTPPGHVTIRTSWVFAAHGRNFVRTMLRLGDERDELRVVDDQTGCPTAAADIAAAALAVARRLVEAPAPGLWGTCHFSSAEAASWHGFAKAIFGLRERLSGRPPPRLIPVSSAEFASPTRRPVNSVLDCTLIARRFGIVQPDWRASLGVVMQQLMTGDRR